jgi:hypothetical protein
VTEDPIAARRERIARVAALGRAVGYGALLVAIVAFFVGVVTDFPQWTVVTTIVALVAACVVLPVPIVVGYGVRAAAREDRRQDPR